MQSSVYELGEQRGEQKLLVKLYERRLQRAMSEGERSALAHRIGKLGVDRLLDLPQELTADELAAWLADPAAS